MLRRITIAMTAILATIALSGCESVGLNPAELAAGAVAALPELPDITPEEEATAQSGPVQSSKAPVGAPTEVYARIARGMLTCWLGANGPLRKTHVFHAEAAPQSKGGQARIALDERHKKKSAPRGRRSFTVDIRQDGGSDKASVIMRNLNLPPPQARQLQRDVSRWAAAEEGCLPGGLTSGWEPSQSEKNAGKKK